MVNHYDVLVEREMVLAKEVHAHVRSDARRVSQNDNLIDENVGLGT